MSFSDKERVYRLRQALEAGVRCLRTAEDIARVEDPPNMEAADRIRSIYEQVSEDVLNGTSAIPPLLERLRIADERTDKLATALGSDDAITAAAKVLHTMGCVRDCAGPLNQGWLDAARVVVEAAVASALGQLEA